MGSETGQEQMKVWTFNIKGGRPFSFRVSGGPSCDHDGISTLWKMVGSEQDAVRLESMIQETTNASVEKYA